MNDIFSTLANAVKSLAPTLATMLGGPLAGQAVSALEVAVGLAPGAGADAVTKVLKSAQLTPEMAAGIQKANQDHEEKLKQLDIDLAKINADHDVAFAQADTADRASARGMQLSHPSFWPGVLTALVTVMVACIVGYDLWLFNQGKDLPDNQILGAVLLQWATVMAYWFGTTRGSTEKNALLAQSMPAVGK
jgi:hypothetical protein